MAMQQNTGSARPEDTGDMSLVWQAIADGDQRRGLHEFSRVMEYYENKVGPFKFIVNMMEVHDGKTIMEHAHDGGMRRLSAKMFGELQTVMAGKKTLKGSHKPKDWYTQNHFGEFLEAVDRGELSDVLRHISEGMDIEYTDTAENLPAHRAAYYGQDAMARLLYMAGAAANQVNNRNETPLMVALLRGHEKLADFYLGCLREYESDDRSYQNELLTIRNIDWASALDIAEARGFTRIAEKLKQAIAETRAPEDDTRQLWGEFVGRPGLDHAPARIQGPIDALGRLSGAVKSTVRRTVKGPAKERKHIVIIGEGASGLLLAMELCDQTSEPLAITLVEKQPESRGGGVAFSAASTLPGYYLEKPPEQMSIYTQQPDSFLKWLQADKYKRMTWPEALRGVEFSKGSLVPRALYQLYLQESLSDMARWAHDKHVEVSHVDGEVISIDDSKDGLTLKLANGTEIIGNHAVLATGHLGASDPEYVTPGAKRNQRYLADIWSSSGRRALQETGKNGDVLIAGSNHARDALVTLVNQGHRGKIRVVAPEVMPDMPEDAKVKDALGSGQIQIVTGNIQSITAKRDAGFDVSYVATGQELAETMQAGTVIIAEGHEQDYTRIPRTGNPLWRQLVSQGGVTPNANGYGIAVKEDGTVIASGCDHVPYLSAIGPVRGGNPDIPDLLSQAHMAAASILKKIQYAVPLGTYRQHVVKDRLGTSMPPRMVV